jgi:hypothetical protein
MFILVLQGNSFATDHIQCCKLTRECCNSRLIHCVVVRSMTSAYLGSLLFCGPVFLTNHLPTPAGGHSPAVKPGGGEGSGRTLVLEGAWSDENFWRIMSLTWKPSMTTSPQKNLPRTSLFFSVQILSLGAVDKTYNCMCELKQSNPLPNETKSHGLFFAEICISQVTNFSNSTTRVEFCI